MCYYKRATFSECNHSQWSSQPMRACQAQRDFQAGRVQEPCGALRGHPLATIKVEGQCAACRGQADKMDERLQRAKDIISVSKQTLVGADERCRAILEDSGIDVPFSDDDDDDDDNNDGDEATTPKSSSSPVSATATLVTTASGGSTTSSTVENGNRGGNSAEDIAAREFLRKRSEQKDSKLYMR